MHFRIPFLFLFVLNRVRSTNVVVNTTFPINTVSENFLGFVWDAYNARASTGGVWYFNLTEMLPFSSGLGPCYFRFGGTSADQLIFQPGGTNDGRGKTIEEFNITGPMVDDLYSFSQNSGWSLIYDINLALFNGSKWDSSNAKTLFDYTSSHGYAMDFELGNGNIWWGNAYGYNQEYIPDLYKCIGKYDGSINTVSEYFLGFVYDAGNAKAGGHFYINLTDIVPLSSGLGPCYFRFGGTTADQLIFQPGDTYPNRETDIQEYNITGPMIDELYNFATNSGWNFIFDLNLALFNGTKWDSSNAKAFLDYVSSHNYKMNFELGNKPDLYYHMNITITGKQVAEAYADCRALLNTYDLYKNSILIGPEVAGPGNLLYDFMVNGGGSSINAMTFHHYYFCGTNETVESYTNVTIMNELQRYFDIAKNISIHTNYTGAIWLSETGPDWCGTARNLTEAFAGGFLWLDKIGLAAKNRMGAVIRESIYGADFGLLARNNDTFSTRPAYWLSFLHKKLVGTQVLDVTVDVEDRNLRLYGASNRNTDGFIVYGVNVANYTQTINFSQITNPQVTTYIVKEAELGNLESKTIKVNGQILEWYSHEPITNIQGNVTTLPIEIPPYSQFFIRTGQSKLAQCPNRWHMETTNPKKCIKIINNFTQPWFGANFDCTTYGINATLVSIDSAFENTEVTGILSNSTCTQFYVGLYNNQSNWVWSNGDTTSYRNWQSGFPTTDGTQKCVVSNAKTGAWSNSDCNLNQCYVCQLLLS